MSEHFAQAILYLSAMQIAESIERVKGVRQGSLVQFIESSERNELIPYILRKAY